MLFTHHAKEIESNSKHRNMGSVFTGFKLFHSYAGIAFTENVVVK